MTDGKELTRSFGNLITLKLMRAWARVLVHSPFALESKTLTCSVFPTDNERVCLYGRPQLDNGGGEKMSKFWCCMLVVVFVLASSVNAAPIECAPPAPLTLTTVAATYSSSGFGGPSVSCGPITFSNWQAVDASGGNTTGLPLNLVSPSYWDAALGVANLSFNPNFGIPAVQDIHLYFTVTSTAPITAIDLGVGGTSASITERACTGGIDPGSGNCLGSTLAVGTNFSGLPDQVVPLSTASTSFQIFKDVNKGANGELTSFTQSFTASVPEPTTLSLIGLGLFGLGFFRRKRHS